jgi:hypothetical protein
MSVAGHDGAVAHTGGDGAGNSALKNRKKQEKKLKIMVGFWSFGGCRLKSKAFGNGLGGRLACEFQLGFVSHAYCPLRSAGWSFGR